MLIMMLSDAPRYVGCNKKTTNDKTTNDKTTEEEAAEVANFFRSNLKA